ncbi:tyrosine-protein phosphatase non-receptor type substrate 1-like [Ahaetulla prasina]|uniref:tyrosine-protein phosphatase non-receptor type substrate 1-like n=1 Tax=Ahaetulla prasina TaxID=499056 RepID=UPI0026471FC8|nr:tyrosine-protein phosphatase non-receptor type substrate 1-like [Ahaetulla prasina]
MAAFRSSFTILGPIQLWFLLLVRHLTECSVQRIVGGRPSLSQEAVTITAGKTLILKCILAQKDMPGSAEWYKDLGNDQKIIFRENDTLSRGVRLNPGSPTDFSIGLNNIGPEESGTYCCSMVKEGPQSGRSIKTKSVVSVIAHPSQPLLRGPSESITVGSQVSFSCSAKEFPTQEITVIWLKDKETIEPARIDILNYTTKTGILYSVNSTVDILLRQEDMGSVLSCQVQHSSLEDILHQDLLLGEVVRGSTKNSPTSLWIALFLNKAAVLLLVSFLFLMKVCKCNCARNHSRLSQEARQSGKPS